MPSIDHRYSIEILRFVQDVLRCSQMFTDVFWIFSRYSIDVLLMFSRCSHDVCRIFPGCFQDAPMGLVGQVDLMIISNESMDFNDPKEFNDPQLLDDPSYSMIPAIL